MSGLVKFTTLIICCFQFVRGASDGPAGVFQDLNLLGCGTSTERKLKPAWPEEAAHSGLQKPKQVQFRLRRQMDFFYRF